MARNSSTFIYLAVAVGLICYLTLIDKKLPGTKEQEEAENQIFKYNVDDVNGLEITNVHGVFVFKKKDDHWEIKSPVKTTADSATITEIINQIAFAQPQRIIQIDPNDKNLSTTLKEWGLAPPAERAIIHTADKTYELLIGRKMAINDSVYSRASGRKNAPVRIIPNAVKLVLEKDLPDFRSRSVFDFEADKAVRVASRVSETATTPAQECEVDAKNGKWTLQKPLVARASTSDVETLLNKILAIRAVDFVTDTPSNLSQYGLTSPSSTLSVTVQPQEELVLEVGGPVPGKPDRVYAQRLTSNSVFSLNKADVDGLLRALPNTRDRHVMPFDPLKATGFSYTFAQKSAQARSEKGLWNTIGTPAGRADVGKITDILARLSQLETTPVLKDSATDLKPFGLSQPAGKITVTTPEQTIVLSIGKKENHLLYVRNSIEPFIYTVPDQAFDFLASHNLDLLDARAINLQLSLVKSMTITAPPSPAVVLNRSPGGTWTAGNVKDRMVDSLKADSQASLFCQLLAKQWLGPALPAYGLTRPVLTIAVQAGQPHPTVLRIGAALPDGSRAAQLESSPTVFALSDGDFGLLDSSSLEPIPRILNTTNAPPAKPAPASNAKPPAPAAK